MIARERALEYSKKIFQFKIISFVLFCDISVHHYAIVLWPLGVWKQAEGFFFATIQPQ